MPVYYCTDHDSHYVGGASVVEAANVTEAQELLDKALLAAGLNPNKGYTLTVLSKNTAVVLTDGDY